MRMLQHSERDNIGNRLFGSACVSRWFWCLAKTFFFESRKSADISNASAQELAIARDNRQVAAATVSPNRAIPR
jgi:hypothetical protein